MTPRVKVPAMTEADLLSTVREIASVYRYLNFHPYDSRRSTPGWPDLVLLHPFTGRLLFRELKTDVGKVTAPQQKWLDALKAAGQDADVWRTADLRSGRIQDELRVGPK